MTVATTNRKNSYTTNGVTTEFAFTFSVTDSDQVLALTVDADGTETEYSNFTLVLNEETAGGTLTTLDTLDDVDLVIYRLTPQTQEIDYQNGGRFPADSHEQALDKLTLQNQDQQEELDRALKSQISRENPYEISGELEEGKLLKLESNTIVSDENSSEDLSNAINRANLAADAALDSIYVTSGNFIGDHVIELEYESLNDYSRKDSVLYRPLTDVTLPYTATTNDPTQELDFLSPFSDAENIAKAQEQNLGIGSKIYPREPWLYIQVGDTLPATYDSSTITHIRILHSESSKVEIMRLIDSVSGSVTAISDTSITAGGADSDLSYPIAQHFNSVAAMISATNLQSGQLVRTGGYYNIFDEGGADYIIKTAAEAASDGDVVDGYGVITLDNGNIAVIKIKNSTVNLAQYGSTGKEGEDNTAPMQAALTFGQTINSDLGFTYEVPYGVHEATHLSIDRGVTSRAVTFKGMAPPSANGGCVIKITDTTQQTGIEWDSGFGAQNVIFDHDDARSVGTSTTPLWLIDIRNTDAADDTADLDCDFDNCWVRNFHRSIRLAGRGFLWRGGSIVSGGGAVSEGCFLDLLWPDPFTPGSGEDQTAVTGMRSIRIVSPRIHACTGTLVHNRGDNANNLYQIDFDHVFSDTLMGLMRGAIVNVNVNGGTWLSCPTIFLRNEAGFDVKNVNLNAPNLLGMPEENIGQSTSEGTVDAATVLANAQGTILYVDPSAGTVEQFNHSGGIVSNFATDAYQINKAIDGFGLNNVVMSNMMKDNKESGGTIRHVVNFLSTASTNININNNIVKNLTMVQSGRLSGNDGNCTEISIANNKLSGTIRDTPTRPANNDFGGDQSQVYCGTFTGEGGDTNITKYTASRYAKSVIVQQMTGTGAPATWMQIDAGDSTLDVRLNNGQLDCRVSANVSGATYSYTMFF